MPEIPKNADEAFIDKWLKYVQDRRNSLTDQVIALSTKFHLNPGYIESMPTIDRLHMMKRLTEVLEKEEKDLENINGKPKIKLG